MKQYVYDTSGTLLSSYDTRTGQPASDATSGTGDTSNEGTSSGGTDVAYSDVGILALNMDMPQGNIYEFRVPGDPNNNVFRFRFPRAGNLLGFSLGGSISQDTQIGFYCSRYNESNGRYDDVATPDVVNTFVANAQLSSGGYGITLSSPVPYLAGDTVSLKVVSPNAEVTVDFNAYLQIQY